MVIVLAKLEGREVLWKRGRTDIGEQHQFHTIQYPVSLVWVNNGSDEDLAKAKNFAGQEYRVFVYSIGCDDPLDQAKTDIYGDETWKNLPSY